jgi:hypothetical protein
MFRQIVESPAAPPYANSYYALSIEHSQDLLDVIRAFWENTDPAGAFGMGAQRLPQGAPFPFPVAWYTYPVPTQWDHLVYAYLVENTRIYEIFRRLIIEYRTGERLGPLTPDAVQWLRNTEELFYTGKYTVGSVTPVASVGSPDWDAARRNAYYRLFGYDLNHGADDNRPFAFVKPGAANREFRALLETLLYEVWKGITNANNTSGKRDTDDAEMALLVLRLFEMLTERKSNGKLVRDEFWSVAAMSWLHMAIEGESPIVDAMELDATSAQERLVKIGQVVGLPPHARTHEFLLLARTLSQFLREVEAGSYQTAAVVPALYTPGATAAMMQEIVAQYSIATGKDLKAKQVAVAPAPRAQVVTVRPALGVRATGIVRGPAAVAPAGTARA